MALLARPFRTLRQRALGHLKCEKGKAGVSGALPIGKMPTRSKFINETNKTHNCYFLSHQMRCSCMETQPGVVHLISNELLAQSYAFLPHSLTAASCEMRTTTRSACKPAGRFFSYMRTASMLPEAGHTAAEL